MPLLEDLCFEGSLHITDLAGAGLVDLHPCPMIALLKLDLTTTLAELIWWLKVLDRPSTCECTLQLGCKYNNPGTPEGLQMLGDRLAAMFSSNSLDVAPLKATIDEVLERIAESFGICTFISQVTLEEAAGGVSGNHRLPRVHIQWDDTAINPLWKHAATVLTRVRSVLCSSLGGRREDLQQKQRQYGYFGEGQ